MDVTTFWKNYGRDLETLLDKAHRRESERLAKVITQDSHYVLQEEKHAFEELIRLKMIYSVVIGMNRSDEVDGQRELTNP